MDKTSELISGLKDRATKNQKPRFKSGSESEKLYVAIVIDGKDINTVAKNNKIDVDRVLWYVKYWTKKLERDYGSRIGVAQQQHQTVLPQVTQIAPESGVSKGVQTAVQYDMKSYIPQTDGYIARSMHGTTDVKLMDTAYEHKHFILLVGETGCGKTHLVRNVAFKKKQPYMRVNMNGATTPEDLAGQWIPNPNNDGPKYVWQDGVLTQFMRHGGIFVVDEINMAPADILSMFHSVTDDERRLVLTAKDGEVVQAHPEFWFVSTMNPDYEGTKPLNLALKSRFRVVFVDYSIKVEKRLNISEQMLNVADKLRTSDEINTPVSTRDLMYYEEDKGVYSEKLARGMFVDKFEEAEKATVKEVIEMMVDGKEPKNKGDDNDFA